MWLFAEDTTLLGTYFLPDESGGVRKPAFPFFFDDVDIELAKCTELDGLIFAIKDLGGGVLFMIRNDMEAYNEVRRRLGLKDQKPFFFDRPKLGGFCIAI